MLATHGSPRNGIHTPSMPLQLRNRQRRRPNIKNHNLITIHQNRRHIPQILLIPRQSQQGCIRLRTFVYNRRMLLIP
ncbi:hypothetical protein HanPSC8_Chr01g0007031 [Helianthus annuus]|nr:hypothetical protein HanPSC8_Chr01g0007031 [Helianthus annuus]